MKHNYEVRVGGISTAGATPKRVETTIRRYGAEKHATDYAESLKIPYGSARVVAVEVSDDAMVGINEYYDIEDMVFVVVH